MLYFHNHLKMQFGSIKNNLKIDPLPEVQNQPSCKVQAASGFLYNNKRALEPLRQYRPLICREPSSMSDYFARDWDDPEIPASGKFLISLKENKTLTNFLAQLIFFPVL